MKASKLSSKISTKKFKPQFVNLVSTSAATNVAQMPTIVSASVDERRLSND
jgi:hypothetical protein